MTLTCSHQSPAVSTILKDVGIGQEVLTEGFLEGKTVTLQYCLGRAIICNFIFLFS